MIFAFVSRIAGAVFPSTRAPSSGGARSRSVELPPLDWIKGATLGEADTRPHPSHQLGPARNPAPDVASWGHGGLISTDGDGVDLSGRYRPSPEPSKPD